MVTNSKPFKIPGCPSVIIMRHYGTGRTIYCNSVSAGSLAEDPALRNAPGNAGSCSRDPAGTHNNLSDPPDRVGIFGMIGLFYIPIPNFLWKLKINTCVYIRYIWVSLT